jgi:hypothetical protein
MNETRLHQPSNDPAGLHRATPLLATVVATLLIGLALIVLAASGSSMPTELTSILTAV